MAYCTGSNFEILPGVFTFNLTVKEVEADPTLGCCQKYVCGLPCPVKFDKKGIDVSFGVPFCIAAVLMVIVGYIIGALNIKGDYRNFFVCNRTLPLYVMCFTLLGQGLDSNSTLGNVTLGYKFAFWDGMVLPLGLGCSLILNGLTLAGPINRMKLLTVPDVFKRQYGYLCEVMVSFIELVSFTFLIAGNLVGISLMLEFMFDLPKAAGVFISGILIASYTFVGGLFSTAYLDIFQASLGFTAFTVITAYSVSREDAYAPVSLGFALDLGGNVTATTPGYTGSLDCVDPVTGAGTCDNYAYPVGDKMVFKNGMEDPDAYAPFPNALLFNWATIFVLTCGNLCALDFQARTMAAKSVSVARIGNIVAGFLVVAVGVPFGLLAGLARKYYGPDSPSAEFSTDTCSLPLGLPSCAQWDPDENFALFKLFWNHMPRVLGGWGMIAIMYASMSTCDGALLATATVMANNIWRKVPVYGATEENLLTVARLFIIPMTAAACICAALAYQPGYLLVVAFDVVLAGVFVPLMAAAYLPGVRPNAGILAVICGSALRIALEFALPKDGSLVAFGKYALAYGPAIPGLPSFMVINPPEAAPTAGVWDPSKEQCPQGKLEDWSGLDSFVSPAFSLLVLLFINYLEAFTGWDTLFFIPKSWREQTPLYPVEELDVQPMKVEPQVPAAAKESVA